MMLLWLMFIEHFITRQSAEHDAHTNSYTHKNTISQEHIHAHTLTKTPPHTHIGTQICK